MFILIFILIFNLVFILVKGFLTVIGVVVSASALVTGITSMVLELPMPLVFGSSRRVETVENLVAKLAAEVTLAEEGLLRGLADGWRGS